MPITRGVKDETVIIPSSAYLAFYEPDRIFTNPVNFRPRKTRPICILPSPHQDVPRSINMEDFRSVRGCNKRCPSCVGKKIDDAKWLPLPFRKKFRKPLPDSRLLGENPKMPEWGTLQIQKNPPP
jgi:hypothetical protein